MLIVSEIILPPTQCPEFNQHAFYLVANQRGSTSRSEKILPALWLGTVVADLFWGTGRLRECNTCFLSKKVIKKTISHQQNLDPFLSNPRLFFPVHQDKKILDKETILMCIYIYIDHFPITKLWKKSENYPPEMKQIRYIGATRVWRLEKTGQIYNPVIHVSPLGYLSCDTPTNLWWFSCMVQSPAVCR